MEAPGIVLSDNEMYFDPGFISTDGQTDFKFSPLNQIGQIDESSFIKFEDYNLSNL